MGIRPNKSIGWGITMSGSELVEKTVDNVLNEKQSSYSGLFDYIEQNNLMETHKQSKFFRKEEFQKLDENKTLFDYIEIISKNYDSDVDFEEEEWTIIFYPMVLSPLAFHNGSNEFKDGDSPFTYAEIEKFFPKSLEDLNTVSYTIGTPPFPSEYSVVAKKDFTILRSEYLNDMKQILRAPDARFSETYAQICGFENVSEILENYQLAPDEEITSFAQYLNIFQDNKIVFDMKPMIAYYWN